MAIKRPGFIEQNMLTSDENILYKPELHPAALIVAILLCYPCLVGLLLGKVREIIDYFTAETLLTDKRVLAKWGLLTTITVDVPLGEIVDISVVQGALGRALDYGTVVFTFANNEYHMIQSVRSPYKVKIMLDQFFN